MVIDEIDFITVLKEMKKTRRQGGVDGGDSLQPEGPQDILSGAKFEQKAKTRGERRFPDARFLLMADEHLFQAFATADDEVRKFITKYVLASYQGSIMPFIMGGLEPTGQAIIAGKKHVFPLDSDYLGLLAMFDGSKPAAPPLP